MKQFHSVGYLFEVDNVPFDLFWPEIVFFFVGSTTEQSASEIPSSGAKAMRGELHCDGAVISIVESYEIVIERIVCELVTIFARIFDKLLKLLPFGSLLLKFFQSQKVCSHSANHPAAGVETLNAVICDRSHLMQGHIEHLAEDFEMSILDTLPRNERDPHQVANLFEIPIRRFGRRHGT